MTVRSFTAAVVRSKNLKNDYFSCTFGPYPASSATKPGHFLHLQLPHTDLYFRRAMSVASVDPLRKEVEIIFKVFGRGTTLLSRFPVGAPVNMLAPLGRPFTPPRKQESVIIIAGGVGFPPLLYLAHELVTRRKMPADQIHFFYGGKSSGDILERTRIKALGVQFHPATDDGSFGSKGLITSVVDSFVKSHPMKRPKIYACGPEGMLKATDELGLRLGIAGELSLEAPMPCGIGVCLGCIVPLRAGGNARVCADGPVFQIGEILL